jgi:hypothetical protein
MSFILAVYNRQDMMGIMRGHWRRRRGTGASAW